MSSSYDDAILHDYRPHRFKFNIFTSMLNHEQPNYDGAHIFKKTVSCVITKTLGPIHPYSKHSGHNVLDEATCLNKNRFMTKQHMTTFSETQHNQKQTTVINRFWNGT